MKQSFVATILIISIQSYFSSKLYSQETNDTLTHKEYLPDITELIITKHRNGPTGIVKLVFDPALTKFKNLARPMN